MKAATWFTNKSVRKVWRNWQIYLQMRASDKRKMLKSSAYMQNKTIGVHITDGKNTGRTGNMLESCY